MQHCRCQHDDQENIPSLGYPLYSHIVKINVKYWILNISPDTVLHVTEQIIKQIDANIFGGFSQIDPLVVITFQ